MELESALVFARDKHQGIITTIAANGRPHLSNILYHLSDDGIARISLTDSRAKTRNLRRDPRASLYVPSESFWGWVVLEGNAQLTPPAEQPDDETVDQLVALYRDLQGEHENWDDYRKAMVKDKRLVLLLVPNRAYGILPS